MMLILAGLALWLLAVLMVLSICRAAARADENEAARKVARAGRKGVSVGLVAAAATLPAAMPPKAEARQARCANSDVPFEAAPQQARAALICEIGEERAKRDLRRLHVSWRLNRAARGHASDMVRRKYFSHYSPGGAGVSDRARRAGYIRARCSWRVGEVLSWGVDGRSTAAATVRAWMDSPPHREILLSSRYSDLGLGTVAGTPLRRYPHGLTAAAVLGRRSCSS